MKGLLHSKRFRKNLYKWLFMYVGVMGLLTSVITYSKYITSLGTSEEARTSKFVINVTAAQCANVTNDEHSVCETTLPTGAKKTCRPTSKIASCFNVDTTGLEVDSSLMLTFSHKKEFEILEIDRLVTQNNRTISVPIYKQNDPPQSENETNVWTRVVNSNDAIVTLKRTIDTSEGDNWSFRVITKKILKTEADYSSNFTDQEIVKVGYVMEQNNK